METMTEPLNATEKMKDPKVPTQEKLNRAAESASAITPTLWFTFAALASIGVSAFLQFRGKREISLFVGQWVPSFLLFGIYNKILKTQGAE